MLPGDEAPTLGGSGAVKREEVGVAALERSPTPLSPDLRPHKQDHVGPPAQAIPPDTH